MKIVLIDGNPLLYRSGAMYAGLSNSKGEPSGIIYGTLKLLGEMITKSKADEAIIFWDVKGTPNWRKRVYPLYKSSRPAREATLPFTQASLRAQEAEIQRFLGLSDVFSLAVAGVEADDVIGLVATSLVKHHTDITILSGDYDFVQLPFDIYDPMRDRYLLPPTGITRERWQDYAALCGEGGDDIPHPAGIGPAKASEVLALYPTVEAIYADTANLLAHKSKQIRALVNAEPVVRMARRLVTITTATNFSELSKEDIDGIAEALTPPAKPARRLDERPMFLDYWGIRNAPRIPPASSGFRTCVRDEVLHVLNRDA